MQYPKFNNSNDNPASTTVVVYIYIYGFPKQFLSLQADKVRDTLLCVRSSCEISPKVGWFRKTEQATEIESVQECCCWCFACNSNFNVGWDNIPDGMVSCKM